MDRAVLSVTDAGGTVRRFSKGLRLNFRRELYTPYALLTGEFITDTAITAAQVCTVRLILGSSEVFCGLPDKVVLTREGGLGKISFTARSYTALTAQNEPEPGVISDIDLAGLVGSCLTHPYITAQQGTTVVNYIYVKPSSSLWEAVVAYNIKALGRLPYIRGTGTIMADKSASAVKSYNGAAILSSGGGVNTLSLLSDLHMRIGDGEYQYHYDNPAAVPYKIRRSRYYELDSQWLQNIPLGLEYKANASGKRCRYSFFSYAGYKGEELFDKVQSSGTACDGKYINGVSLTLDERGARTRIDCYDDPLGQR